MSAADLMAVLMSKYLHYDFGTPDDRVNDHLIFSKGHYPLLYAMFKAAGAISDPEMLTFRRFGSRIEGHPLPCSPGSTSPADPSARGCRSASASRWRKRLDRLDCRIWCLAAHSRWPRVRCGRRSNTRASTASTTWTAICDVAASVGPGEMMHGWDVDAYRRRVEAFGWKAIEIDGHDVAAIGQAVGNAGQTTAIIAGPRRARR